MTNTRRPQEITEALAGQISNQDEDEVEDELDALDREVHGVSLPDLPSVNDSEELPNAPTSDLDAEASKTKRQKEKERARRVALAA